MFSDKIALVTGASGGIGAATAAHLIHLGATVVVADRTLDLARAAAQKLGASAVPVELDVADVNGIQRSVRAATDTAGPIDILVNNAGIFDLVPLLEVTEQHFDRLFQINTKGAFFVLQAVARSMVEHHASGTIVNVASQAGRRGEAPSSIYAASKAAVISLTQSAALALLPHGIRVNAVAPGVVDTPMWQQVDRAYAELEGKPVGTYTSMVEAAIPAGRVATSDEIAHVIAFLAGPDSSYVFGQTFNVDGGNVLS